jgi:hypothetical protein
LSEFHNNKKRYDGVQSLCKECVSRKHKDFLQINKERLNKQKKEYNHQNADINRKLLLTYLSAHSCIDCGESDPIVLEFDHVTGQKVRNVSDMVNRCTWPRIEQEISKCVVRCANCHRRKTARDYGWFKHLNT